LRIIESLVFALLDIRLYVNLNHVNTFLIRYDHSMEKSIMQIYKLPTVMRNKLTTAWSNFFQSLQPANTLFAITVVFRPVDTNNSQERWETEYTTGVLKKIRRCLERHPSRQEHTLPFPDFYYFERNESSIHRITGSRKPFHIHALLPVRSEQVYRIWSIDNNNLHERLLKDIHSLGTVQSILVEIVREGQTLDWIRYVSKLKTI
jgi:hypothetical protein